MTILYLLISITIVVLIVVVGFLVWTVKSGQYDDLEGPAHRILMDDDDPRIPRSAAQRKQGHSSPTIAPGESCKRDDS